MHKVHTLDAAKGRLDPLTPRVADAGVADLPGLAPLGVPGGGCVPAPPSGPDGPHHPGLAAGGQLSGVARRGPGLRGEARQAVCGGEQGLVPGAAQRERVDPGGPRGAVGDSRHHDPGERGGDVRGSFYKHVSRVERREATGPG